jgi:ArsR family transcriptional regulator, arsenate/arsenite/antimonite-responsive transcriptional repressor
MDKPSTVLPSNASPATATVAKATTCGPAVVSVSSPSCCAPSSTATSLSSMTSSLPSTLMAAGFHALSDPIRLKAIDLLRHQELCVCDLRSEIADVSQSKLSFHLKVLREAELVRTRQQGRWIYYSLNLDQFFVLEQYLVDLRSVSSVASVRRCC